MQFDILALSREGNGSKKSKPNWLEKNDVGFLFINGVISPFLLEALSEAFLYFKQKTEIKKIQLNINSPGGEVAGVLAFCEKIFEARKTKNIVAKIEGYCCSAAYFIASACEEIQASPTSIIGSIGVSVCFSDFSELRKNAGIRDIEFVSSGSPAKNQSILSEEGRASIQALLDDTLAIFLNAVSKYRNQTKDFIEENYGKGATFLAGGALQRNMIDFVGFQKIENKDTNMEKKEELTAINNEIALLRAELEKIQKNTDEQFLLISTKQNEMADALAKINELQTSLVGILKSEKKTTDQTIDQPKYSMLTGGC